MMGTQWTAAGTGDFRELGERALLGIVFSRTGRAVQTAMPPVLAVSSQLDLHTRCESQVENEIDRGPIRAGDRILSEDYRRDYPDGKHRPTLPSRKYNCHGLTFASRRTWIWKPSEVAKILKDDEYEPLEPTDVLPGDVVIYTQNGDVEHSGIVVSSGGGSPPIVLSKWGMAHEVLHRVRDCPYDAMQVSYHRIRT